MAGVSVEGAHAVVSFDQTTDTDFWSGVTIRPQVVHCLCFLGCESADENVIGDGEFDLKCDIRWTEESVKGEIVVPGHF